MSQLYFPSATAGWKYLRNPQTWHKNNRLSVWRFVSLVIGSSFLDANEGWDNIFIPFTMIFRSSSQMVSLLLATIFIRRWSIGQCNSLISTSVFNSFHSLSSFRFRLLIIVFFSPLSSEKGMTYTLNYLPDPIFLRMQKDWSLTRVHPVEQHYGNHHHYLP